MALRAAVDIIGAHVCKESVVSQWERLYLRDARQGVWASKTQKTQSGSRVEKNVEFQTSTGGRNICT